MNDHVPAIKVQNIDKDFGDIHAVCDVSFELHQARSSACLDRTAPAKPPQST